MNRPAGDDWAARVRVMVETTCAEQGIAVAVTDRAAIDRAAVLLSTGDGPGARKRGARARTDRWTRSEAPPGSDALDGY